MRIKGSCGNIYRSARVFAGMTIEQAAEQIGIAPRTLAGYEKGEEVRELVSAGLALMFIEKEKSPAFAEAQ